MSTAHQQDGQARCAGRMAGRSMPGQVTVRISVGHVQCLRCLRRTDAPAQGQQEMTPPAFVGGRCLARLGPEMGKVVV